YFREARHVASTVQSRVDQKAQCDKPSDQRIGDTMGSARRPARRAEKRPEYRQDCRTVRNRSCGFQRPLTCPNQKARSRDKAFSYSSMIAELEPKLDYEKQAVCVVRKGNCPPKAERPAASTALYGGSRLWFHAH